MDTGEILAANTLSLQAGTSGALAAGLAAALARPDEGETRASRLAC